MLSVLKAIVLLAKVQLAPQAYIVDRIEDVPGGWPVAVVIVDGEEVVLPSTGDYEGCPRKGSCGRFPNVARNAAENARVAEINARIKRLSAKDDGKDFSL